MPHLSPAISGVRPTWLVLAAANATIALSLSASRAPPLWLNNSGN